MKTWILVIMPLISGSVHASKIIGNGGNVIVCKQAAGTVLGIIELTPNYTLLDFYEAEKLQGLEIKDPGGVTYQDKFRNLMKKVAVRFPSLATDLLQEFNNFERHQRLIDNVILEDTTDSYHSVLPRDCHIEQIAIQRVPMFPRDPWFLISKDLWDGLDDLGRAGLALHETLYRIGLRSGIEHSRGVRYIVGLLFSSSFMRIPDRDWISGFLEARIREYNVEGARFPLFTGSYLPCELKPGMTSCGVQDTLVPADVVYRGDMLSSISYKEVTNVSIAGLQSSEVSIYTDRILFEHSLSGTEIILNGTMDLCEPARHSTTAPGFVGTLMFNGHVRLGYGQMIGTVSPLGGISRPAQLVEDSLSKVVSQFASNPLYCSGSLKN